MGVATTAIEPFCRHEAHLWLRLREPREVNRRFLWHTCRSGRVPFVVGREAGSARSTQHKEDHHGAILVVRS